MTGPIRPERRTLLELDALLEKLEQLAAEGDRRLYDADERYRWGDPASLRARVRELLR
ncbi:hypothetical protein [Geodermatophilus marinus]|uniref:hypothetical protein n=1 Tax=Geodermatophilus sp. LHW52908 TaxID=2303986 RepID=UPI001314958E|nr:hypothetical protein [Geodermatophilus sp. LHW52908]